MLILTLSDMFISGFVITPLVICFWWGLWSYVDYFDIVPIHYSLHVSTGIILFFTLLRELLYNNKIPGLLGLAFARLYIYIFGASIIIQWRALFAMFGQLLDTYVCITISFIGIGLLVLSHFRCLFSLLSPPYFIFLDHSQKKIFIFPTLLKIDSNENVWMYLLDCVFSVCFIGILVVLVWRGFWTALDTYLYPENLALSTWISLGVGYAIVGIAFALQPSMKYLAAELSGVSRMLIIDIYLFFSFCGTVNVWRGTWNFLTIYFLPNSPELSYALGHFLSFLLLVLINSSNSVLVRGVYIDGEEEGPQCVEFPCYYLRLFLQAKREKKILHEAEKSKNTERGLGEGEVLLQIENTPFIQPNHKKATTDFGLTTVEVNHH